ncbi:MAG: hypothetical protein IKI58_13030, partial [Oscillospiraceae bacterium]|nr:hypothetical protein [Oscillospiraceae bacterium]
LFSRNREFRCLRAATRGSASGLRDLFEKRSIKNFNDNPIEVSRQTERHPKSDAAFSLLSIFCISVPEAD